MITSRQNEKVKQVRSLQDKKNRDKLGLYIIEGVKLVREAKQIGEEIVEIFSTEKVIKQCPELSEQAIIVSDDVFKSISYEVTPQGILAVVKKREYGFRVGQSNSVYLDGVQDPSNVGAIIRTAVASGYTDLYMRNCGDAYSPKAVRSSMGGIFRARVMQVESSEILEKLNCPIVVADMNGEDMSQVKIEKRFCLVIGNEAHGVSREVREKATKTVRIPMENGMESLNASVSAGILMYALKNSNK